AKLGEGIGQAEAFHRISEKTQRSLPKVEPSRPSYTSLQQALKVLAELERNNPVHGLAMRVQLESACRLVELNRLRYESLAGITVEGGKTVGILELRGKGDRLRQVTISELTYWELEKTLKDKCKLIDYNAYRSAVRSASEKLGLHSG